MIKMNGKNFKKGSLILEVIKFDHIFKRTVMRSGTVGKVYLPRELIGKDVYIVVDMNGLNGIAEGEGTGISKSPSEKPEV
jgi:putative transposon-encoded protein